MSTQLNYDQGQSWGQNREEYTPDEYSLMEQTAIWAEQEGMDDLAAYERGVLSTRSGDVVIEGMVVSYE